MGAPMANTNIRDITVDGSGFKDQFDQGLMNPIARETQDTVTGDNPQKEYIAANPPKGDLGSFGRH